MKKHIILTALASISMLLAGCSTANKGTDTNSAGNSEQTSQSSSSKESSSSSSSEIKPKEKGEWTILIYMCGSDLESGAEYDDDDKLISTNTSEAGYASKDINEILSVKNQPKDVNIVIETGGARAWANSKIKADKLGRWHVEGQQIVNDAQLTYKNMGASSTLSDFLTWGLQTYPAEKTGVILWNHGGAMQGVCQDETKTGDWDMLSNSEVKSALKTTFSNVGLTDSDRLEFIGYDACLMQVQDVAEFNSQYFNYMIASQESEAGEGWEYNTWVSDLYSKKSTEAILTKISDRFVDVYSESYPQYYNDQTQSFLDLSKMSAYKTAWESMASKIGNCIKSYGKSDFHSFLKSNVKYFSSTSYTDADLEDMAEYYSDYYGETITVDDLIDEFELELIDGLYWDFADADRFGVFDAADFLQEIKGVSEFSSIENEVTAAQTALNELIVHNKAGDEAGDANGLSFFFPLSSSAYRTYVYTTSETNFTNWRSVVNTYGV